MQELKMASNIWRGADFSFPEKQASLRPVPLDSKHVEGMQLDVRIVHQDRRIRLYSGMESRYTWRKDVFEVDLSEAKAWSGLPWQEGRLNLEQNPALSPLSARGSGFDPGVFYEMRNTSIVEAGLEDMTSAVLAADYGLRRNHPPEWLGDDLDHALAAHRHWDYSRRVWYEWHRPTMLAKKKGFAFQSADLIRTVPWLGFGLFEIVAEKRWWQLMGDPEPREYLVPFLEWRAPASVYEWVIQGDDPVPVGVVLRNDYARDSFGHMGDHYVVLSRDKYVHVAARDMGRNPEGRSHLRSAYEPVKISRVLAQIEGLSYEVNGLGTWKLKPGPNGWSATGQQTLEEHLLNYKSEHVPSVSLERDGNDIELISPQSSIMDFSSAQNRQERSTMLALNSEDKLIGVTKHGSHAAREAASTDSWRPYGTYAEAYVAMPHQETIARAVAYNFPEDEEQDRLYPPGVEVSSVEKRSQSEWMVDAEKAKVSGVLDDPRTAEAAHRSLSIPYEVQPSSVPGADVEPQPAVEPSRAQPMTTGEVAEMINTSTSFVRDMAKQGHLPPAFLINGRYRFRIEDVEAFISAARKVAGPS